MHYKVTRRRFVCSRGNRILLGSVCTFIVGAALTINAPPTAARALPNYLRGPTAKHKAEGKQAGRATKLPFGDIPKGPLEIFISIDQQRLHFYSDGVHVADEPVATGVPGHLTPLGVFSVIQRDRYHHSNIYSNAPMPYMERITWSGVALHEGVGLGHPASHGCIRMPHDFAARLWMLPTMGMRVIIARPELRPLAFVDTHLFVHKDQPVEPMMVPTAALTTQQPANAAVRTDAIGDPPGATTPRTTTPAAAPKAVAPADAAAAADASDGPAAPKAETAIQPLGPALAEIAKQAAADAGRQVTSSDSAAAAAAPPAAADPINQAAAPSPPADSAPAAVPSPPPASDASANTGDDEPPLPPIRPAAIAHGSGPIAIFISRKTGKIYVRQNFTPLFDAPVTIANPGQPIGTHVFTAMDYLPDHSTFRWTMVTLPKAPPKQQAEHWKIVRDGHGRVRRVRVAERPAEPQPAESPQDALARIQIPQDVIDQISQLIVPGSSLIVSDQGLGPETGEGTDFIVVAR